MNDSKLNNIVPITDKNARSEGNVVRVAYYHENHTADVKFYKDDQDLYYAVTGVAIVHTLEDIGSNGVRRVGLFTPSGNLIISRKARAAAREAGRLFDNLRPVFVLEPVEKDIPILEPVRDPEGKTIRGIFTPAAPAFTKG